MSRHSRNSKDDGIIKFVAMVILAVILLPFVGGYLSSKPEKRKMGIALVVLGLALWVVLGVVSS